MGAAFSEGLAGSLATVAFGFVEGKGLEGLGLKLMLMNNSGCRKPKIVTIA